MFVLFIPYFIKMKQDSFAQCADFFQKNQAPAKKNVIDLTNKARFASGRLID